ncbi:MAG: translation initiation factor IF-2 N-terminal domain-containing protein, partial [Acidimicrobiales bacterium]|nr:translation initiation factor IF-2 N-terminal domain-containing protein [Acidimicrobiales bacterium]
MPSNIRVYELARELGLSNKECLSICADLGIGVKSHSSSMVDAQADRVRAKALREGLVRAQPPEEEAAPAKAPSSGGVVSSKKAPPRKAASPADETPTSAPAAEA